MKKAILMLVALSLVVGTIALAKEGEQKSSKPDDSVKMMTGDKLEKISSPEDVKNFDKIVKKGKELYGMRKMIMEKIMHPSEMVNFSNVKKVGNTLWGVPNQTLVRPEAASCVKAALDKRDATLKSGIANGTPILITVIDARTACQKAALDETTVKEQREANKVCIKTYKNSVEKAKKAINEYRDNVWKTLKEDLKACSLLQGGNGNSANDIKIDDGGLGLEW